MFGRGENPVEDEPVRDAGGDFHLEVEELLNRGDHGLKIIRNRILFPQVQDVLDGDRGETKDSLSIVQHFQCFWGWLVGDGFCVGMRTFFMTRRVRGG